jgi:hypothetical protein
MAGQVLCALETPRAVIAYVRLSVHVEALECWNWSRGGVDLVGTYPPSAKLTQGSKREKPKPINLLT